MNGKVIDTVRGAGVYQEAMDFAIQRLNEGEWVCTVYLYQLI
jgi:monolysocardiolipin acyltransferase